MRILGHSLAKRRHIRLFIAIFVLVSGVLGTSQNAYAGFSCSGVLTDSQRQGFEALFSPL
jgi:hypothetical protein